MNEDHAESLFQFFAGYWYPRSATDLEILDEVEHDVGTNGLSEYVVLLQEFLDSERPSSDEKADFVRHAVRRHFAGGQDPVLDWVRQLKSRLQLRIGSHQKLSSDTTSAAPSNGNHD
ncbi:MAG: hypothetical protein JO023_27645 [Chloroflexi bacterium]|nr:hypothetical protein [Chloroflexota bacterium]